MKYIGGIIRLVFPLVLAIHSLSGYSQAPAASESDQNLERTRAYMNQIANSLMVILPMNLNQEEFDKPDNRSQILGELTKLRDLSGGLVEHTQKFDSSYGFVAASMARDLRDIHHRFERGASSEARFLLQQVVENCATCHMKLPDPKHAPKLDSFFKNAEISKLSPFDQVRLKVATRQFEEAAKSWEEIFATWSKPSEIFAMDALVDYMKVTVRVLGSPKRARVTLDSLSKRVAIPKFLSREISGWIKSLKNLETSLDKKGDELKRARLLISSAKKNMDYPLDRVGIVDFIGASSLLNRFLETAKATPAQRAEAYYLLGNCETLLGRSAWLSQGEFYFEAAVRAAPQSKYGAIALDALEQHVLTEYSGSGGVQIPEDVQANLDVLRHLVSKAGK